jgi:hypothetical protein
LATKFGRIFARFWKKAGKNRAIRSYENASVFIPLLSLASMIKVKQLFSTFHAFFLFLKNSGTASSSSHVFPPPSRNDIPVSLAFEKFPQTLAVLNRFVQARPSYTSSVADTTCAV